MLKAVNIFLLVLWVSVQTPVAQLLKLPHLIAHFNKHQQKDGYSLLGFFEVHYSITHNDADRNEDDKLPFKDINTYSIGFAIVPVYSRTILSINVDQVQKTILPEAFILQQDAGSIFHPPRIS
jgi:hypothetical protein